MYHVQNSNVCKYPHFLKNGEANYIHMWKILKKKSFFSTGEFLEMTGEPAWE